MLGLWRVGGEAMSEGEEGCRCAGPAHHRQELSAGFNGSPLWITGGGLTLRVDENTSV